jgi:hypothetical protein
MLFIWGSNVRRTEIGVVADLCPRCGRVRAHTISEYHKVAHVYFIPLGGGSLVGIGRECYECGAEFECDPRRYNNILDADEAGEMSIRDILEETNTRLADYLESEGDHGSRGHRRERNVLVDRPAANDPPALPSPASSLDSETEGRRAEALRALATHIDSDRQAVVLTRDLRDVPRMSPTEREILFERVDAFLDRCRRKADILRTVGNVAGSRPSGGIGCLAGLLFAAAPLSAIWWVPLNWPTWGLVLYAIGLCIAGLIVAGFVMDLRDKHWLRGTLIPALEEADHDLVEAREALAKVDRCDSKIDEGIRDVAGKADALRSVLQKTGKWQSDRFDE